MSNFNSFKDDGEILMKNLKEFGDTRVIRPPDNLLERKILEFRKQLNTISKGDYYKGILKDVLKQYDEFFDIIHLKT